MKYLEKNCFTAEFLQSMKGRVGEEQLELMDILNDKIFWNIRRY